LCCTFLVITTIARGRRIGKVHRKLSLPQFLLLLCAGGAAGEISIRKAKFTTLLGNFLSFFFLKNCTFLFSVSSAKRKENSCETRERERRRENIAREK
jgi:hypothetical protein